MVTPVSWLLPKLTTKLIPSYKNSTSSQQAPPLRASSQSRSRICRWEETRHQGEDQADEANKEEGENRGGGENRKNTSHKNTTLTAFVFNVLASLIVLVVLEIGFNFIFIFLQHQLSLEANWNSKYQQFLFHVTISTNVFFCISNKVDKTEGCFLVA